MISDKCEHGKKKSGECKKKSGPKKKSAKRPKIKWWGRSYAY